MSRRTILRVVVGIAITVAVLYAPYYYGPAINQDLSRVIYFAIAAMGLNLLTGFNGQISIGHGAFFGVGAFTTAILMDSYGMTFELTLPFAAATAAILGVLIGIPALRVRGLYLALVTLGLAVLFPRVGQRFIEGAGGIALVRPDSDGFDSLLTVLDNDQWQYLECLVIAAVLFLVAWNLRRSRVGRAMIAIRDQEIAAPTVGINLARVKVGVFALSAAYAGVAGSLSVMITGAADATDPTRAFINSIYFLVAVVIGGTATITGPALGALILVLLQRETDTLIPGKEALSPAIFGGALILVIYVLPEGAVGGLRRLTDKVLPTKPPEPPGNNHEIATTAPRGGDDDGHATTSASAVTGAPSTKEDP